MSETSIWGGDDPRVAWNQNSWQSNVATVVLTGVSATTSIGTVDAPFKDLYVQSSSIYFADMSDHGGKSWKQMTKSETTKIEAEHAVLKIKTIDKEQKIQKLEVEKDE